MKKRMLSEFMCIEMLYDYKSKKLDALREAAVEECLEASPRAREELKKLSQGMAYADKLKEIKVSLPLTESLMNQPKTSKIIFGKFHFAQWPQSLKWGLEGAVVAVAIALFVTQMPQLFKNQNESSIVEVKRFESSPEKLKEKEETLVADNKAAMDANINPEPVNPPAKVVQNPPQKTETVASVSETQSGIQNEAPPPAPPKEKPVKKQGYVYRLVMIVDNVDEITPQIVDLLVANGGQKAGEVELGWRRKGGSYFHFTIPKVNYEIVTEGLKKYSTYNLVKSEHPRVMPDDVERFILWVEERKQN